MKFKRENAKRKLSLGGSVLLWGVVIFVVGIVGVVSGMTDYTDHTETVEAVVSERVVDYNYDSDGDRTGKDVTVYVDYTAEDTDYTGVVLDGLNTDDYRKGQDLTVAYAPDDPGHVVTPESTEEGAYDIMLYLGIAGIVVSVFVTAAGAGLLYLQNQGKLDGLRSPF